MNLCWFPNWGICREQQHNTMDSQMDHFCWCFHIQLTCSNFHLAEHLEDLKQAAVLQFNQQGSGACGGLLRLHSSLLGLKINISLKTSRKSLQHASFLNQCLLMLHFYFQIPVMSQRGLINLPGWSLHHQQGVGFTFCGNSNTSCTDWKMITQQSKQSTAELLIF